MWTASFWHHWMWQLWPIIYQWLKCCCQMGLEKVLYVSTNQIQRTSVTQCFKQSFSFYFQHVQQINIVFSKPCDSYLLLLFYLKLFMLPTQWRHFTVDILEQLPSLLTSWYELCQKRTCHGVLLTSEDIHVDEPVNLFNMLTTISVPFCKS